MAALMHVSTAMLLLATSTRHVCGMVISPLTARSTPKALQPLSGNWAEAKSALRKPDCCVVKVAGLEKHLQALQDQWDNGPPDVDLRARIRVGSSGDNTYEDCLSVRHAVTPLTNNHDEEDTSISSDNKDDTDPCTLALQELARGVASLADGPFETTCDDVFLRVVCASSYKARDPMFHTDKAPLRGYVTLKGPGTDYMTRTSTPLEYMTLRGLGTLPAGGLEKSLTRAGNLEFIVMKGDHYEYEPTTSTSSKLWQRSFACVHRSPPATSGGRRVIVSLDLADGDDDREWYEVDKRREWRAGMTQRKSKLVA